MRVSRASTGHGAVLIAAALAAAGCTSSSSGESAGKKRNGSRGDAGSVDNAGGAGGGSVTRFDGGPLIIGIESSTNPGQIIVTPADPKVTVDPADPSASSVTFKARGDGSDQVTWAVSNPDFGSIDDNGVFTPSGRAGGTVEVTATVGNVVGRVTVTIAIAYRQNGAPAGGNEDAGVGGLGGVGGEGLGSAVSDAIAKILDGKPSVDSSLSLLYPYDETVFPLGILPPLFQWTKGSHGNADGVYVHLSAPPYFDYKGYFAPPAALPAGDAFVRHSVPKDVWTAATRTAAGSTLDVEVVVAADGKAWGPMHQSYKIALAPVTGKIYYQAYNTALAHNYDEKTVSGALMGGATLSITVGQESPELVAGKDSSDHSGCRVCHSVSAYGDRMVVQHGEKYVNTSSYDLKNGNKETTPYVPGTVGWAGLYPDGQLGLSDTVNVGNSAVEVNGPVALYDMNTGAAVPAPGLSDFATSIGLPAFSPDGKHAVFVLFKGNSTPAIGDADGKKLVVMDFDLASKTFSNPRLLWGATADDPRPSWSSFLPSSNVVVFQRRWQGTNSETFATREGARGELWWVDLATATAGPMDRTNGIGADGTPYVPKGDNNHDDDVRLSYEPSISPVASGGYAWMVFMSRRMYGNVATIDPWASDPRKVDLTAGVTPKKIWMAAIDLSPTPGKDPSHPAFYIPGQELHGVNSRPFFALQPCLSDRGTCTSGIDCCTGFCRNGLCQTPPEHSCAVTNEKCTKSADCCDSRNRCIGGFCATFLQ
jgi:hypothetical protein